MSGEDKGGRATHALEYVRAGARVCEHASMAEARVEAETEGINAKGTSMSGVLIPKESCPSPRVAGSRRVSACERERARERAIAIAIAKKSAMERARARERESDEQ
eukprot:4415693-Pleurochrysis_carterae.AAC.2